MPKRRKPQPSRTRWTPLTQRRVDRDNPAYAAHDLRPPDQSWANDNYTVAVRDLGHGALHLSIHRYDRETIRDWRHLQAIKNEIAGPERTAIEIYPPESQLVDAANEFHLWVLPADMPLPFVIEQRNVKTEAESVAEFGPSKARQRPWEHGLPTGPNLQEVVAS